MARYSSFTRSVIPAAAVLAFGLALSPNAGGQSAPGAAARTDRAIPLRTGSVDLQEGAFEVEGRYHLVAFQRPLKVDQVEALRAAGVSPQSFVYENTWLCALEPRALDASVRRRFAIVSVMPWRSEYKLAPALRRGELSDWATTARGSARLLVKIFDDVPRAQVLAFLGDTTSSHEFHSAPNIWAVVVDSGAMGALADEPIVMCVEEGPIPFMPVNDMSRALIRVEQTQQIDPGFTPPVYNGLSGAGVQIAISEHARTSHPDFQNHDAAGNPTGSRFLNTSPGSLHGTHVAGIIGGNGWNSDKFPHQGTAYQWRGMAPEATLISGGGYGLYPVDASNHSYVLDPGIYGLKSSAVDQQIFGGFGAYLQKPHVWAAANQGYHSNYDDEEGYYSIYAPAKNALVVGALNTNDASLAVFSSLGPTFDGRIKPDVMAGGNQNSRPREFDPDLPIIVLIDYIRILESDHAGQSCTSPQTEHCWEFNQDGNLEGWFPYGAPSSFNALGVANGFLFFSSVGYVYGPITGLNIPALPGHIIEMRYAIVHPFEEDYSWFAAFSWKLSGGSPTVGVMHFKSEMDGQFHVVSLPVGVLGVELDGSKGEPPIGLGGWKGSVSSLALELNRQPYTGSITSTWVKSDSYLEWGFSGTSMAAPAVTGTVALLLEQFVREHGIDLAVNPPLPSTTKAVLIQTATDLVHATADPRDLDNPDTGAPVLYFPGPDFATGYGMVNAEAAVTLVAAAAQQGLIHESVLDAGESESYLIHVAPGSPELKLTLAWDDTPGSTVLDERARRLVNDLDLVLIDPLGRRHRPWRLDALPIAGCGGAGPGCGDPDPITQGMVRPAYKGPDGRNNVEQIQVLNPTAGRWKVLVSGLGVSYVATGPQSYSLVSNLHAEQEDLAPFLLSLDESGGLELRLALHGRFGPPVPVPDPGAPVGEFVIGEFTWDGDLDIIVATDENPPLLYLYERLDTTTFAPSFLGVLELDPAFPSHGHDPGLGLIAADLNDDGFVDFLECINVDMGSNLYWIARGNAHISDGAGSFSKVSNAFDFTSIFTGWTLSMSSTLADVNGDGFVDMLAAEQSSGGAVSSNVYLLTGRGDGSFDSPVLVFATNGQPASFMALGDFNRDGNPDALVGQDDDGDPGSVWFFEGFGDGTFDPLGFEAYDVNPGDETGFDSFGRGKFQAFDADADGVLDVVSAFRTSSSGDVKLVYLKGRGDGTFADHPPVTIASCQPASGGPCLLAESAFQVPPAFAHDLVIDADLNGDRVVDEADLRLLLRNITAVPDLLLREFKYDLNGDLEVNFLDLIYVHMHFTGGS